MHAFHPARKLRAWTLVAIRGASGTEHVHYFTQRSPVLDLLPKHFTLHTETAAVVLNQGWTCFFPRPKEEHFGPENTFSNYPVGPIKAPAKPAGLFVQPQQHLHALLRLAFSRDGKHLNQCISTFLGTRASLLDSSSPSLDLRHPSENTSS